MFCWQSLSIDLIKVTLIGLMYIYIYKRTESTCFNVCSLDVGGAHFKLAEG